MPNFDHIVIVVMENHSYQEVIGSSEAPFINQLATDGLSINNAYGEEHPSQPNYFWLFSGSNQGVTDDSSYWPPNQPGPVFDTTENLYTALQTQFSQSHPNFFGGYVDSGSSSPVVDYYQDTANYANRHVPWLGFTQINDGDPAAITRDFATEFPTEQNADFSSLPLVSIVIPALDHDMHNYDSEGNGVSNTSNSKIAVNNGDQWLQENLQAYAYWAVDHNSLLILTWDEDSSHDWITPVSLGGAGTFENASGLTAPNLGPNQGSPEQRRYIGNSGPNQIAMVFYGANLSMTGHQTVAGAGVNNINLLRTIESIYGLSKSGAQTSVAENAGMSDEAIPGIFTFAY